jgi:hypothetical protein
MALRPGPAGFDLTTPGDRPDPQQRRGAAPARPDGPPGAVVALGLYDPAPMAMQRFAGSVWSARRALCLSSAVVVGLTLIASGFGSSGRQTASVPDATKSTVVASPLAQIEGGSHSAMVTVTLLDSGGSPVAGKQVSLKTAFGIAAALPKTSDGSGIATFSVKEIVPRSDTYVATDTTDAVVLRHEATVRWVSATEADAGKSTAVVTPGARPVAGSFAKASVKLTIKNGVGDPLPYVRAGISTVGVHLSPGSDSATDSNGTATLELDGPPGQSLPVTITAGYYESGGNKGNPFPVLHPTVAFPATAVAGEANAKASTVEVSPASVPSDGTSLATVTVTLKDAAGIPVPGKTIHLAFGAGGRAATILPPKQVTGADGTATFKVKATTPGLVRLTASDVSDSIAIADSATVTFKTPAPVSTTRSRQDQVDGGGEPCGADRGRQPFGDGDRDAARLDRLTGRREKGVVD